MGIRQRLSRPIPLWVLLVGILTTASVATAITLGPGLFYNRQDFQVQSELGSVQTFRSVVQTVRVFVRSLNGFSGVVSMTVMPSSSNLNAYINVGGAPSTVLLGTNDTLWVTAGSSIIGNYRVTVTGSSSGVSHSTTIPVVVQDFTASASPNSITVVAGQNASARITISGVNGLEGSMYLVAGSTAPFHGPGNFCCATQLSTVSFSNGSDCSALRVSTQLPEGQHNCAYELLPFGESLTANVTITASTQDAGTSWTVYLIAAQNSVLSLPQTVANVTVN